MKMRPFELSLVIVFGVLGLLALILLSTHKSDTDQKQLELAAVGQVQIWGTLPAENVDELLAQLALEDALYLQMSYSYYPPAKFDTALTNALADQVGPDLILVSQEKLVTLRNRILPVSYKYFPERDIRGQYLEGAQVFALADGLYGHPVAIDPLVMYWNQDILANAGYLQAPETWEELVGKMLPQLVERDFDRTIRRSVVAMGEYRNVRNAFGVLSTLLLQGGSKGVSESDMSGIYFVGLNKSYASNDIKPLRQTASFYTQFTKSSNVLYSWNRSLPEDRQQFAAEDLVFYFGYGSEGPVIEKINPNLNFDIAEVPQDATATVRRTYGKFYALSVLKSSQNISGAQIALQSLVVPAVADQIAKVNNMVPAYRSSVAAGSNDVYGRITYRVAPITYGWLNPSRNVADSIFGTMVEDVNENRKSPQGAAEDAVAKLNKEYTDTKF